MGFDTQYRPLHFKDVVGQEATIDILKKLLLSGQIFERSYIFAGPSGTGKTTLARILGRAMLCGNLQEDGEPCDECSSCRTLLEGEHSFSFVEMDAANNSGKDSIRAIVEDLEYATFGSNDRRLYLIDECHRLSTAAMDALLKPLEDTVPGTNDKQLVGLFCTTELEKLRGALKSRSLVFQITTPPREALVQRLLYICLQESIRFEKEALEALVDYGRGHVRDMVSALERVSCTGDVTLSHVRQELGLDIVSYYYDILKYVGEDIQIAFRIVQDLLCRVDPTSIYKGMSEAALSSFRVHHGVTVGMPYSDVEKAKSLYSLYGGDVLHMASRLATPPYNTEAHTLYCALAQLNAHIKDGTLDPTKNIIEREVVIGQQEVFIKTPPLSKSAKSSREESPYHHISFEDEEITHGPVNKAHPSIQKASKKTIMKTVKREKGGRLWDQMKKGEV